VVILVTIYNPSFLAYLLPKSKFLSVPISKTVVFDIPDLGRVGVCICYDLWFPELIRDLIFKGAEVIVIITLSGTQDRRQETVLCQAAAIQNQCYVMSINGVGGGGKGESLIVDPEGIVTQQAWQLRGESYRHA